MDGRQRGSTGLRTGHGIAKRGPRGQAVARGAAEAAAQQRCVPTPLPSLNLRRSVAEQNHPGVIELGREQGRPNIAVKLAYIS